MNNAHTLFLWFYGASHVVEPTWIFLFYIWKYMIFPLLHMSISNYGSVPHHRWMTRTSLPLYILCEKIHFCTTSFIIIILWNKVNLAYSYMFDENWIFLEILNFFLLLHASKAKLQKNKIHYFQFYAATFQEKFLRSAIKTILVNKWKRGFANNH